MTKRTARRRGGHCAKGSREHRNSVSHSGYRKSEEPVPTARVVVGAARLGQTRTCTTDESVMRNGL